MVAHNPSMLLLMQDIPAELLQPPVNVLRLSLHPQGVAPKIVNLLAWRDHLFERLRHQINVSADPVLAELLKELQAYPVPADAEKHEPIAPNAVAVPLLIRTSAGVLSFLSTTTVFGTPIDITLSELALETFFPADEFSSKALRHLSDGLAASQKA
jgi:hypothetical protein